MKYAARFEADTETGGFIATFRDIPEAIIQGETDEEAMTKAADALLTTMDFYFEDNRPVPLPSKAKSGERLVSLPASVCSKLLLLNEMLTQKITPSELARRLCTTRQEVNRLIDLSHATKIDRIEEALGALGKRLNLVVV